ncbi:MAG: hypothetical protein Q9159_002267 [Coniocarpon cinnabarinum]
MDGHYDPKPMSNRQVRLATQLRAAFTLVSSFSLLLTIIFLIVAEVGSTGTSVGRANIYFIKVSAHPFAILFSLWSRIRSGRMDSSVVKPIAAITPYNTEQVNASLQGVADWIQDSSPFASVFESVSGSGLDQQIQEGQLYDISATASPFARSFEDLSPSLRRYALEEALGSLSPYLTSFDDTIAQTAVPLMYAMTDQSQLDTQDAVPRSIPNYQQINSISKVLKLHDLYTVGLWGYCEGYANHGITQCSEPEMGYAFNPVHIFVDQLLSGSTIPLPSEVVRILHIIKIASQVMFACFLSGACLSFVLMFVQPLMVYSRWTALALALTSLINAILVTGASIIATVMFLIMRNVLHDQKQINVRAQLGVPMFTMIWLAAANALHAMLINFGLACCCASRRDVRSGRKMGNRKAYIVELDPPQQQRRRPEEEMSEFT